jgi:1-acyl-sn-glycerol-3-phosphate acyltransferase
MSRPKDGTSRDRPAQNPPDGTSGATAATTPGKTTSPRAEASRAKAAPADARPVTAQDATPPRRKRPAAKAATGTPRRLAREGARTTVSGRRAPVAWNDAAPSVEPSQGSPERPVRPVARRNAPPVSGDEAPEAPAAAQAGDGTPTSVGAPAAHAEHQAPARPPAVAPVPALPEPPAEAHAPNAPARPPAVAPEPRPPKPPLDELTEQAAHEVTPERVPPPGVTVDADDLETIAEADAPRLGEIDFGALEAEQTAPPRDDYDPRRWGRTSLRGRAEQIDDFGLDPTYVQRFRPVFDAFYRRYFRVQTRGIENVPATGRALIVCNHAGTLPWDCLMLQAALRLDHPARRALRWLAEDFVFHAPFLGTFLNRLGAVRANPENAERLLGRDALVAVFPEGAQGIGKPFPQRYRLQRFGRGGYVKLALRTRTPIVPCAIVGAEEAHPLLFRSAWLGRPLGLPFLPVTPTFPWLGPLGLVPLPSKWTMAFGTPVDLREHPPEATGDAVLVQRVNERVRATVQSMVDAILAERGSAFLG